MSIDSTIEMFIVFLFILLQVGVIVVILYFVVKKAVKDAWKEIKKEDGTN